MPLTTLSAWLVLPLLLLKVIFSSYNNVLACLFFYWIFVWKSVRFTSWQPGVILKGLLWEGSIQRCMNQGQYVTGVFQGWLISSALNTISVCPLARLYLAVNLFRLYNHRSYSLIRVLDHIIIGSIICCLAYIVDRKKIRNRNRAI